MLKYVDDSKRIQFMDGYELYPDQHVLLGYTEDYEDENGAEVESGVVLAVADKNDRDEMWKLYTDYLTSRKHGDLILFYFGNTNASGVYI